VLHARANVLETILRLAKLKVLVPKKLHALIPRRRIRLPRKRRTHEVLKPDEAHVHTVLVPVINQWAKIIVEIGHGDFPVAINAKCI